MKNQRIGTIYRAGLASLFFFALLLTAPSAILATGVPAEYTCDKPSKPLCSGLADCISPNLWECGTAGGETDTCTTSNRLQLVNLQSTGTGSCCNPTNNCNLIEQATRLSSYICKAGFSPADMGSNNWACCDSAYGNSCSSSPNVCGTRGSGTITCDGNCTATIPPPPANQGNACQSAPNVCGMRGAGTWYCGTCSGVKPSDSLCGANPLGSHDALSCTSTFGWAFDDDYAGATNVLIYEGASLLGTVTANEPSAWILPVHPTRPNAGWTWTIPANLKDGQNHTISVYAVNVDSSGTQMNPNIILVNSPHVLNCIEEPTGSITSAVCSANNITASGDASDPQPANVPIRIYDGQFGLGGVLAGNGIATPAFSIPSSQVTDGQTHTYYAYAQDNPSNAWYQLTGSAPVTCDPIVSLVANPATIDAGESSTISWTTSNATSCVASPTTPWYNPASLVNGVANSSGGTGALLASTPYSLTCQNAIGTQGVGSDSVVVNAVPPTGTIQSITDTDYCTGGPGMDVGWSYSSPASPISAIRIEVIDGLGGTAYDSGITAKSPADITLPYNESGEVVAQGGSIAFGTAYTTRLTVWDANNTPSTPVTAPHSTLAGPWVVPSFSHTPSKIAAQEVITFNDTSEYNGYAPAELEWNFGDGSPTESINPVEHTFESVATDLVVTMKTRSDAMPLGSYCNATEMITITKPVPQYREVIPQ